MEAKYQELASKLSRTTTELAQDSDEKDHQSAVIDAKLAALRLQNKVL
jgi:hypothetical protein